MTDAAMGFAVFFLGMCILGAAWVVESKLEEIRKLLAGEKQA